MSRILYKGVSASVWPACISTAHFKTRVVLVKPVRDISGWTEINLVDKSQVHFRLQAILLNSRTRNFFSIPLNGAKCRLLFFIVRWLFPSRPALPTQASAAHNSVTLEQCKCQLVEHCHPREWSGVTVTHCVNLIHLSLWLCVQRRDSALATLENCCGNS